MDLNVFTIKKNFEWVQTTHYENGSRYCNHQHTKVNYKLLCDVETFLDFICIFPLLEIVQGFSKFA
jgi:hypothetical protein